MRIFFCVALLILAGKLTASGEDGRIVATPETLAPPMQKWVQEKAAIRISDLSKSLPSDALSEKRQSGKWKVIPYATASFQGKAIVTGPETDAPAVSLPLSAKGWHAVYVGVGNVARGAKATNNGVWLRLSGDPVWHRRNNTLELGKFRCEAIEDIYFTVADLTGKSIEFKQMPFLPGAVMYVRAVPLTVAEVALYQQSLKNPWRNMIATIDGHAMMWENRPRTADDLRIAFDGFDASDFGKWWYQIGGADLTNYPTRVGTMIGSETSNYVREADREFSESMQSLEKSGINTLQVAREAARENHAEFHVFIRPSSWQGAVPWEENFSSEFYQAHPEWKCIDRDGTPTLYLSYAVPEVRRHIVDQLRETLECQPDGVGVLFHRGVPLILWEPAFVAAYQKNYGKDPHEVDENDPTIGEIRGEILTSFMREIRTMLDETARQQGRKIPYKLSLTAFSLEKDNQKYGLDVARWVKEKIVNGDVSPTSFSENVPFAPPDIPYYKSITAGSGVGVFPMYVAWRAGEPEVFLKKLIKAYDAGATGIALWDPDTTNTWGNKKEGMGNGQAFDVFRFVGNRELMKLWIKDGVPKPLAIPLTRYGDNNYSRWFPNTGL